MNLIDNVVFDFRYIAKKYEVSFFKVESKTELGDAKIGPGFLVNLKSSNPGLLGQSLIITNQHVVQYKNIQVFHLYDTIENHTKIVTSSKFDLAAICLTQFLDIPSFHIDENLNLLDDIIIIGYPPVPTARYSYKLVHKGEINSFITDYQGNNLFLYSAKAQPGNSGGPVINEFGMVVGIVTQHLYE